jgi:hypothetical protein
MFNPNDRRFERGYVVYSDRAISITTVPRSGRSRATGSCSIRVLL